MDYNKKTITILISILIILIIIGGAIIINRTSKIKELNKIETTEGKKTTEKPEEETTEEEKIKETTEGKEIEEKAKENRKIELGEYIIKGETLKPEDGKSIEKITLKENNKFIAGLVYIGEAEGTYRQEENKLIFTETKLKIHAGGGERVENSNDEYVFEIINENEIKLVKFQTELNIGKIYQLTKETDSEKIQIMKNSIFNIKGDTLNPEDGKSIEKITLKDNNKFVADLVYIGQAEGTYRQEGNKLIFTETKLRVQAGGGERVENSNDEYVFEIINENEIKLVKFQTELNIGRTYTTIK